MKRKIVKHGPISLTVSLPSKWVKRYALKPGDEIEVVEEGANLKVISGKDLTVGEFRVRLKETTYSYLKSVISNAYKKGYDRVFIEYENENVLKGVQKAVDSLLGIEIVSKSKNECEIRNISRELEAEFDSILKNSVILLIEMSQQVFTDVKNNYTGNSENIYYNKEVITKYTDFCKRILNKYRKNEEVMVFEYLIVWSLEKIANEYQYLYNYCIKSFPIKLSPQTLSFFRETNELLELYSQALLEKNIKKIEILSRVKDRLLFKEYYQSLSRVKVKELPIMHHLANIVRRLWDSSGPLHGRLG